MNKPKPFITISLSLYIAVAIITAFVSWQHYYQTRLQASHVQLQQFSQHLFTQIEKYAFIPQLLAQNKGLTTTLLQPNNSARRDITNRYLEQINQLVQTSDVYLIDKLGHTIAASNWQKDNTFIGQNFSFRPYFQQAINGQHSQYFALGSMSGLRGYYYSSPIIHAAETIGVIVVKIQLSSIEDNWGDEHSSFVVTDNHQIVIMTNQEKWLYKSLVNLPPSQLIKIKNSRRYLNKNIDSLGFMGDLSLNPTEIFINNKPNLYYHYLSLSQYLPKQDLNVRILVPKTSIIWDVINSLLILTLISVLIFLIILFYHQRKIRLQQIEHIRERAQSELEFQVLERTSELHAEIHTRIQTETALRQTQDELVQTAKLAVLGQMSASISHELNNPLAAIRSFSDNARQFLKQQNTDKVDGNLERISDLTVRMANISQQLKHFAKRTPTHELVNANISLVIKSAHDLMQPELKAQNVTIDLVLPGHVIMAKVNPISLEQVIINTLTNAIDAMSEQDNKQVTIQLSLKNNTVVIDIHDNGCGISHDQLDDLFKPFYTSKHNGLGLGLSISQQIIQSMKGSITAKNKPSGGAKFTLTLPTTDH